MEADYSCMSGKLHRMNLAQSESAAALLVCIININGALSGEFSAFRIISYYSKISIPDVVGHSCERHCGDSMIQVGGAIERQDRHDQ